MTFDRDNLIESILSSIDRMDYTKSEDIPNLDLYMDQLTTFMEKRLSNTKRKSDDKIMTKTMVNNYAKSGLLPSPEKKKYTKDHIMILFFIYYFKNILSINDIQKLLGPLEDKYFNHKSKLKLSEIYDEVFQLAMKQTEDLKKFVEEKTDIALKSFPNANPEDEEFLHYFTFICT